MENNEGDELREALSPYNRVFATEKCRLRLKNEHIWHVFFIKYRDIEKITIRIANNKMSWCLGAPEKYTLKMKLDLALATEVIFNGDPVTSYMVE